LLKTKPDYIRSADANAVKPDYKTLPGADAVSKDVRRFLTCNLRRSEHIVIG
jgi:hypothetical protein